MMRKAASGLFNTCNPLLASSWVVIGGVISRVSMVITPNQGYSFKAPLIISVNLQVPCVSSKKHCGADDRSWKTKPRLTSWLNQSTWRFMGGYGFIMS